MTFTPNITSVIDNNNSKQTILSANEIFTGVWTDVSKYENVCVYVNAEQPSQLEGFNIQFSPDQNISSESYTTTINANIPYTSNFQIRNKYFRVIYENAGVGANIFIQSSLKIGNSNVNFKNCVLSTLNSGSLIVANGNFDSIYEDVSGYAQISSSFTRITGVVGSDCTYNLYFSSDTIIDEIVLGPYTLNSGNPSNQIVQPLGKYFRFSITNGSLIDISVKVETRFWTIPTTAHQSNIDDIPTSNETGATTKSILYGQYPNGSYNNISISNTTSELNSVNVAIQDPISVFGELAVASVTPVTQLAFLYNTAHSQLIKSSTGGTGIITVANRLLDVNTGGTIESFALAQSKKTLIYRGGQGSLVRMTAIFDGNAQTGSTQLAGVGNFYTDSTVPATFGKIIDGYFFGFDGLTFGILHASSASGALVMTWIPQTDWNGDDFSGNGGVKNPSGKQLDPYTGNVYQIKYQYLGYGTIRFYIENSKNGALSIAHVINYVNAHIDTNVSNPNMSVAWYANNGPAGGSISVKGASAATFLEGLRTFTGPRYGFSNSKNSSSGARVNIFTLKCLPIYPTGGILNFSDIKLANISVSAASGGNVIATFEIILNNTLTGDTTFTNVNDTESIVATNIAGTIGTNGTVIYNAAITNSTNFFAELLDTNIYLQPGDTLTFSIKASASAILTLVAVSWVEDT